MDTYTFTYLWPARMTYTCEADSFIKAIAKFVADISFGEESILSITRK